MNTLISVLIGTAGIFLIFYVGVVSHLFQKRHFDEKGEREVLTSYAVKSMGERVRWKRVFKFSENIAIFNLLFFTFFLGGLMIAQHEYPKYFTGNTIQNFLVIIFTVIYLGYLVSKVSEIFEYFIALRKEKEILKKLQSCE